MTKLKKELTLFGLTMVAIGSCIGSGIFLTPSGIAKDLQSPSLVLIVWAIGGVVALTGALTFAELGGMFTGSGGVYVYLKKAYGNLAAFLYGWCIFTVITSGAIAALAIAFARYVDFIIPLGEMGRLFLAILAILLVTLINVRGVKLAEMFASLFTALKLLGILFIIMIGFIAYFSWSDFQVDFSMQTTKPTLFASALIGVLWSYGGWHHASYLAGEAKDPQRTIPRAMMTGALVVTITYLLINLAYLFLLPINEIAGSTAVAADAVKNIFGWGGIFIAILIAVSTFGTVGIYTLSAPRIYFAMAKDGVFFEFLTKSHSKFGTPANAIYLQSAWAIMLLLFWGTFENLIHYVVFMDWIFMTLAAASIYIFRKKMPNANRPYKTVGYPIIPAIFILISVWFLVYTLFGKPNQAIAGLALCGLGVLVYFFFKRPKTDFDDILDS